MSRQPPETRGFGSSDRNRAFGRFLCQDRLAGNPPFELWRARTQGLAGFERAFAIKVLPDRAPGTRPDAAQRLVAAGSRAMAVRDARIAHVLETAIAPDSTAYVVTEFVFGGNLAALGQILRAQRERARLSANLPALLAHVGAEMAAALAVAHAAKPALVHGALSPANVVLTTRGQVKLLDFGLRDAVVAPRDANGRRELSPYAAPELLLAGSASIASDLFALGAILFELVTGAEPPSARNPRSSTELTRALGDTTPALRETILQLVKADPVQRLSAPSAAERLRQGTAPLSETELRSELGALARRLDLTEPPSAHEPQFGAVSSPPRDHASETSDPAAGFSQIPTRNIFRDGFSEQKTAPGTRPQPHLASRLSARAGTDAGDQAVRPNEPSTTPSARPTPRSPAPVVHGPPARVVPGRLPPPPPVAGRTIPGKGIPPLPPPDQRVRNLAAQITKSGQRSQPAVLVPCPTAPPVQSPDPAEQPSEPTLGPFATAAELEDGPPTVEIAIVPQSAPAPTREPSPPLELEEADTSPRPRPHTNMAPRQLLSGGDLAALSSERKEDGAVGTDGGARLPPGVPGPREDGSSPTRADRDPSSPPEPARAFLEPESAAADMLDMNQLTKGEVDAMFAAGIRDTAEELAGAPGELISTQPRGWSQAAIAHLTEEHPDFSDEAPVPLAHASGAPLSPTPSPRDEVPEPGDEADLPPQHGRTGLFVVIVSALCAATIGIGVLTVFLGRGDQRTTPATPVEPRAPEPVAAEPITPRSAPNPAPEPVAAEPVTPRPAPDPAPEPVAELSTVDAQARAIRNSEGLLEFRIVTEPPGAEIWINGASRGRSPITVGLRERQRKLAIVLPGHATFITTLDHESLPRQRTFILRPLPAWSQGPARISVECERAGQYPIYIDQRETGFLCPADLPVSPGPHRVEIYVPWRFSRYELRTKVAAGETQSVRFTK